MAKSCKLRPWVPQRTSTESIVDLSRQGRDGLPDGQAIECATKPFELKKTAPNGLAAPALEAGNAAKVRNIIESMPCEGS
jgi:hypothetical protein